jgi:CBS domain-containing membrane protein
MNGMNPWECGPTDISDKDVLEAMKSMEGYIDITPGDFREVYRVAYRLAMNRLLNAAKARDVMRTPVLVVEADMDLIDTAAFLAARRISGAPVVDRGDLVGVISEKDFLTTMGGGQIHSFMEVISQCLKNKGCIVIPMRNQKARDIMTSPAVIATEDMSVSEISGIFTKNNINRIPIVGHGGKLVGIVTRSDLLTSYCKIE